MTTRDHHQHDTELPADLEPIASRLDALARDDRDSAPTGLAARLARTGAQTRPPSVIARVGFATRTLRIAAAFALIALAGFGAYLVSRPSPTAPRDYEGLAQDAEEAIGDMFIDAGWTVSEPSDSFWSVASDIDDTWFNEEDAL